MPQDNIGFFSKLSGRDAMDMVYGPETNSYDRYGRGASPETALRLENMLNLINKSDKIKAILKKNDVSLVSPDFIEPGYKGGGRYNTGGELGNKILLNRDKPMGELLTEILPHELRHKQAGSMGGVFWGNTVNSKYTDGVDNFIKSVENEDMAWRLPQERMAYEGGNVLLVPTKYTLPGELRRASNL